LIGSENLFVFDLKNPKKPRFMSKIYLGWLTDVRIFKGKFYASTCYGKIVTLRLEEDRLKIVSQKSFEGCLKRILFYKGYMITFGRNFMLILNPKDLREISRCDIPNVRLVDAEINGNYAYLLDYLGNLITIDFTDPMKPRMLNKMDGLVEPSKMKLRNGYLFISDGRNGLVVVDLSDPQHPRISGDFQWFDLTGLSFF